VRRPIFHAEVGTNPLRRMVEFPQNEWGVNPT